MNAVKQVVAIALCAAAFTLPSSFCLAQQVTGESGSPNATTTIDGKQLPPPDPKFGGVIKEKAGVDALVAAAHRTAQGCAECAAHHDRR